MDLFMEVVHGSNVLGAAVVLWFATVASLLARIARPLWWLVRTIGIIMLALAAMLAWAVSMIFVFGGLN